MKIIRNKVIPFKSFQAANIFGVLFVRKEVKIISDILINHEKIHTAQMKEMLYIFFYAWYAFEWLIRLIQYRDGHIAYRNVSFEREAYENGLNLSYLNERKRFTFLKYLNKK